MEVFQKYFILNFNSDKYNICSIQERYSIALKIYGKE